VERALRERLFDPALVDTPAFREYVSSLRRLAGVARDDIEFAFGAFAAARRLPVSHVGLSRRLERSPPPTSQPQRAFTLAEPAPGALLLRFASFGIEPGVVDEAFEQIAARRPGALILDLRDNPGGTYVSMRVAAHLLDTPRPAGVLFGPDARAQVLDGDLEAFPRVSELASVSDLRHLVHRHGAIVAVVRPVRENRFSGPLVVLINRRTASAAEPLAELLQRAGRAVLVGQRTAGMMLSSDQVDVGQGWVLTLPALDYVTINGRRIEGRGVSPDVTTPDRQAVRRAIRLLSTDLPAR